MKNYHFTSKNFPEISTKKSTWGYPSGSTLLVNAYKNLSSGDEEKVTSNISYQLASVIDAKRGPISFGFEIAFILTDMNMNFSIFLIVKNKGFESPIKTTLLFSLLQ